MEVHEKIRVMRQFKGWSQEEIAEKLNMSAKGYANIEHGNTDIKLSKLEQISETFGMSLLDLLELDEKNIFNFTESQNYNSLFGNFGHISSSAEEKKLKLELQEIRSIIEQQTYYFKEIIELLKKN